MFIDLHTHTTFSDGTFTPEALVQYAKEISLQAVAITDHDSVAGNLRGVREGALIGCEVVPGVELSATSHGTLHILGLFVDSHDFHLRKATEFLQANRRDRNLKILSLLRDQGIIIDETPFLENAYLGRPHIAQLLVDQGVVPTIDDAFQQFLRRSGPAYVDRVKLSPEKTLEAIEQAGGICVLAHPVTLPDPETVIDQLLPLGLRGIEAYYPSHSPAQTRHFLDLAEERGLLVTGGSDFHGDHKPSIDLGCMHVPSSLLAPLKEARKERLPI